MTPDTAFPPTRDAGLARLRDFLPKAAGDYTRGRNYDLPEQGHPHVSQLSPYLRHRLVTEAEVLDAVLGRYSLKSAEKFVQEVYWRTYWKGWLERRPSVWMAYKGGLSQALDRLHVESGLRAEWEAACKGETGIDGFDAWARELVSTGYMHNHARMWFASIWIFTLRLPWELGADFFLRHLLDGDAASNTLSWRWVAGLQTQGKNYAARASNISKYTEGRHRPVHQLASDPAPLMGPPHPPADDAPVTPTLDRNAPWVLVLTEDDLSPGFVLDQMANPPLATAILDGAAARSPLTVAPHVTDWTSAALDSTCARYADRLGPVTPAPEDLGAWARGAGAAQIVMPYTPEGPARDLLRARLADSDLPLVPVLRDHDAAAWPHAKAGFFKFKEKIPALIARRQGLSLAS
ncbi:FAD-binding domain-containing protein [Dinoroseobacter sp. PD6]|uniref:FAD-binding domain-containing protein n=1 Tax=Dinoroseobacter sp. PD6 TaxID=3028384 RepID=UPI00237ACCD1|nr:FAD-binding domain-containing protein [Dinoroseobacter sp. PD6]MDD9716233.1 FAD-binding domain-containing protein [Dinoroseobacter sp. PD6]